MKKNTLLLLLLLPSVLLAQIIPVTDDMEDYEVGQPIFENWWTTWSGTEADAILCSDFSDFGDKSAFVDGNGTINSVLNLGSIPFPDNIYWPGFYSQIRMYIPSGKEAYFNLQQEVPIVEDKSIFGDIYFNKDNLNPGVGYIEDTALGMVEFSFPHDEWFNIFIDINQVDPFGPWTWIFHADNQTVFSQIPFTNSNGELPAFLGGINFASKSAYTEFYIDYIHFDAIVLGVDEHENKHFTMAPNPTSSQLLLPSTNAAIETVRLFSGVGTLIFEEVGNISLLDLSGLASGLYFVEISSDRGREVHKVVKE